MPRAIVGIFALAVLVSFAIVGGQAALENAGEDNIVVNESWTPDAGNFTTLDESERAGAYYGDSVNVYDENETKMNATNDYDWNVDNGTVKASAGGRLDGDSEATITYEFQQTTAEQRRLAHLLAVPPEVVGVIFPAFIFLLLFMVVRG